MFLKVSSWTEVQLLYRNIGQKLRKTKNKTMDYRSLVSSLVTNIGTPKMVYICHRTSAAPDKSPKIFLKTSYIYTVKQPISPII